MIFELLSSLGLVGFGVTLAFLISRGGKQFAAKKERTVEQVVPASAAQATPSALPHVQKPAETVFFLTGEEELDAPEGVQATELSQTDKVLELCKNLLAMTVNESVRLSRSQNQMEGLADMLAPLQHQIDEQQVIISEIDRGMRLISKQIATLRDESIVLRSDAVNTTGVLAEQVQHKTRRSTASATNTLEGEDKSSTVRPAPQPMGGTIAPVGKQ